MVSDAHEAAQFYATRRGALAAHLVRERLGLFWPSLPGQSVLGLGYAAPYLRLWREQAARCVALTPAQMGAARWPVGSANLSCTAEEDALPFPDLCFDRVLLVAGQLTRLLRDNLFTPTVTAGALFGLPFGPRLLPGSAKAWERIGRRAFERFAGVVIVEATKSLYMPDALRQRRRMLAPRQALAAGWRVNRGA